MTVWQISGIVLIVLGALMFLLSPRRGPVTQPGPQPAPQTTQHVRETRDWRTMPISELDPQGLTTRRMGHFDRRYDMICATHEEMRLRRLGTAFQREI